MGAIYISPNQTVISERVLEVFKRKGFNGAPHELKCCGKSILLFEKQSVNIKGYFEIEEAKLMVIGTCFYRHLTYEEGIKQLLNDFIANSFSTDNLIGSYFIVIAYQGKLHYIIDPLYHQCIYFDKGSDILSSSFLACLIGASEFQKCKKKVNKKALTEILVTGSLIGAETIVEDIFKVEKSTQKMLEGLYIPKGNNYFIAFQDINSQQEAVDLQLRELHSYLEAIKPNLLLFGGITGITGGFDSRLLLLSMIKENITPKVYINAKSKRSIQYKIADRVCKSLGLKLICLEQHDAAVDFKESFYFNDGFIRIYQIWTEQVKTKAYLERMYEDSKIGFSGIGGEQYRNSDYLTKQEYKLTDWIKGELLMKYSGKSLANADEEKKMLSYLMEKIKNEMSFEKKGIISFDEIKKFQNYLMINANRTLKNNIDNQLVFFLSPFIDPRISSAASMAFKYLGPHHEFEKMMIEKIDKNKNLVEFDYGYSAGQPVPFKYSVVGYLKRYLGLTLYYFMQHAIIKKSNVGEVNSKPLERIKKLNLPINFNLLFNNELLAPLLVETEFFLNEMDDYIE